MLSHERGIRKKKSEKLKCSSDQHSTGDAHHNRQLKNVEGGYDRCLNASRG
jgi:hypothetical protein